MQNHKKKILAIPGSTKSKSSSLSILKYMAEVYRHKIDMVIYDRIASLDHFNPELEDNLPENVVELQSLISQSDGVLFCTPEYVFSLPGSLKNLIEWNVSTVLFSAKPVAMIVAAASGQKAFESLDLILTTLESCLPDASKLLIRSVKGKMDKDGIIEDAHMKQDIEKLFNSLLNTIEVQQKIPTKYNA